MDSPQQPSSDMKQRVVSPNVRKAMQYLAGMDALTMTRWASSILQDLGIIRPADEWFNSPNAFGEALVYQLFDDSNQLRPEYVDCLEMLEQFDAIAFQPDMMAVATCRIGAIDLFKQAATV